MKCIVAAQLYLRTMSTNVELTSAGAIDPTCGRVGQSTTNKIVSRPSVPLVTPGFSDLVPGDRQVFVEASARISIPGKTFAQFASASRETGGCTMERNFIVIWGAHMSFDGYK